MAIVFSVDKFMSEVRALTNITGNGIATVFVWWWEDELDHERLHANLNKTIDRSDVETAITTGWRERKVISAVKGSLCGLAHLCPPSENTDIPIQGRDDRF